MKAAGNYVDSHGQSEIGFGLTKLLGYQLLPRIKRINTVKLYRPGPAVENEYPRLEPAMTRAIRWDLIEQNYDMLVKYATAIRVGTASTEAILRRFTGNASHPVYQAMLEVGRAQKTVFVARYLRDRALQHEIEAGLNVVEGWNGVNDIPFLRQIRRTRQQPHRPAALGCRRTPPAPSRADLRQHPHDPGHPRRTRMAERPNPRRPARPQPAVHLAHDPLWRGQAADGQPPGAYCALRRTRA